MSQQRSVFKQTSVVLLALLAAAAGGPASAQSTTELAKGKQLFLGMCSRCHGVEGGGGEGPNLNRPVLIRAQTDQALLAIIRDGIPDRGMPRVRRLMTTELSALVVYVKSLGAVTGAPSKGRPEAGKVIYTKLGCAGCHVIEGAGGSFGPELTAIGAHRSADYLRQAILDPSATMPRGISAYPGRGFNEYVPIRAVMRDGKEVRGIRANEDSFTIQVRDAGGQLYSLRKADLKELDKQLDKSLMPDYKTKVSATELDDLVAYLGTLGGAK